MIGRRLKLARTAAGLSLSGLEDAIGNLVTAQAIGKYERDESMPGSGVLIALADALGVSVDYLVGDEEMVLEAIDFRKSEPPHDEPLASREGEKSRRFKRLCLRALAEGAISEPKAAELLGMSVRELNRHMNEPTESVTA